MKNNINDLQKMYDDGIIKYIKGFSYIAMIKLHLLSLVIHSVDVCIALWYTFKALGLLIFSPIVYPLSIVVSYLILPKTIKSFKKETEEHIKRMFPHIQN